MMGEMYMPGATTVGLVCKDGVILSADKRVSYGYMVMSKGGKKTFRISECVGAACAGLIGDMQVLLREVAAYAKLYELDHNRQITVKAATKSMGNILFGTRYAPYLAQTIVGGVDDEEGSVLYVLDPAGSLLPDVYAAVGSGAEIAIGVLESSYKKDMSIAEGREVVLRAMKSALARDAGSGNGIDLLIVSKDGIREETVAA